MVRARHRWLLLGHALGGIAEASRTVGVEVVVVDAIDDESERLNLRCSAQTLATLRDAARAQDQDLTSFVLGAALDRARAVIAEDRILRLTPHEVLQLEEALDAEPRAIPQLAKLFGGIRATQDS